jgi:hypothetical protein
VKEEGAGATESRMAHEDQDALIRNRVCDSIDVRVQEGDERPSPRDPESHSVIVLYIYFMILYYLLHVRFQQKHQTTFLLYAKRDENVKNKT